MKQSGLFTNLKVGGSIPSSHTCISVLGQDTEPYISPDFLYEWEISSIEMLSVYNI